MKILLYCIFTNDYVKMIKPWLETTAKNFYPHCTDVLIITDNEIYIKDYNNILVKIIKTSTNRNDVLHNKRKRHAEILKDYKGYDLYANIQSNCLLPHNIDETNFPLPNDKLSVFAHTCDGIHNILQKNICKLGSCGYRSIRQYDGMYIHSGMCIAPYDIMLKMCNDCNDYYLTDYKKDKLHCVPYHDESYLNSWRVDNKELVNILPRINSGDLSKLYSHANPFFLVDKNDFGIYTNKYVSPKFTEGTRLGNWLFLIAACYAHVRRNGYDMKMPYKKELPFSIRKNFSIDMPNDVKGVYVEPTYHYTPIPSSAHGYFQGFFQSSKYFNDYKGEIKNLFGEFISENKKMGVAGIHVRMGDYLKLSFRYKSPNKDFIERAIKHLSSHITHLIVFSDEIDKAIELIKSCKGSEHFIITPSDNTGENSEIRDINSMTACEELIMSCSSFSWWAAYLGEHKKVIVDKKWYNDNDLIDKDIYEDNWICI